MQIAGLPLEDGGVVLFEVDDDEALGPQPVSNEAVGSFEEALKRVQPAAGRVLASL
jgi:hypothetical protein